MSRLIGASRLVLLAATAAILHSSPANAGVDPAGCTQTGVAITVSIFRADGTTGVVGPISECETIIYQARLAKSQDISTICAFSGAEYSLTTPDGVKHVISADVPCIGGDGIDAGCDPTRDFLDSAPIPYTVRTQDIVNGLITATANYGVGFVHDNTPLTLGASATSPKANSVVLCTDNDNCTIDECDPTIFGSAGCSNTPVVCNDNNLCTTEACDPATGQCVFTPVTCNDNNLCTIDSCNPATGCETTPVVCNDNNFCTIDTCNPATGCETTPVVCNDNDNCTIDTCNPATGCETTPVVCNDNSLCTTDACNPATGQCVFTPVTCNDNDNCTIDSCDPATGCETTPVVCNDNDPCTNDTCDPATGQCVFVDNGSCVPSGCRVTGGGKVDACGPVPAGCDPSTGDCAPDCDFPALDATHGGQVGAPIGTPTAFSPDSVCIQGEWTHVRHIRPGLFGNFHASTFDSLMCACLPCAENPDSPGVIGALCNPGDRICGPEPRKAPDNKICFSGVGKYAETKGRRADRAVIFRTDVEDRSEPGGGTANDPPDRYRLRLWLLDSTDNHGALGDPDDPSSAAYALRQAVGCANPTTETVTAPTPDIDDGGDLIHGNQQIHPSLDKTCDQ